MKIKNQLGMGLLEVIIASGILTVVMLGLANMMTSSAKTSHSIERGLGWDQMVSQISLSLSNPISCMSLFGTAQKMDPGAPITLHFGSLSVSPGSVPGNHSYGGMIIATTPPFATPTPAPDQAEPLYWAPAPQTQIVGNQATGYFRLSANIQGNDTNAIVGGNMRVTDSVMDRRGFFVTATVDPITHIIQSCGGGTGAAHSVLARVSFSSCNLIRLGDTDHGCNAVVNWGTTLPTASYSVFCNINFAGGYNSWPQIMYGGTALSTTSFSYFVSSIHNGDTGKSFPFTCEAVQ